MKILFTAEYDEKYKEEIKKLGEVEFDGKANGLGKLNENKIMELSKDKDIIITSYDDITKNVIDNAENLKLIACTRANPVNIDIEEAHKKGIRVIYTPGRNSDSAAEHTIAMMLSIARNIPFAYQALKDKKFTKDTTDYEETKEGLKKDVVWNMDANSPYMIFKGDELKDKKLGIIGFGSIGKRVANIAQAFGMDLLIYDPFVSDIDIDKVGRTKVSLDDLLSRSDFISVHLKVNEETTNLIGAEAFDKMKTSAYFINTSRAAVVDERELIVALKDNKIRGAAVDVFQEEPIFKEHPFINELSNIVITPHIAGATYDILSNHTKMIISDIKRFYKNNHLLYEYK